jgi:hypothetical protein
MSRESNVMLRAIIERDGSISGFELTNYSGGGSLILRVQQLPADDTVWWVVEKYGGPNRTFFVELARAEGTDDNDLDELARELLRLVRTDQGLEERDAAIRRRIEYRTGEKIPVYLVVG